MATHQYRAISTLGLAMALAVAGPLAPARAAEIVVGAPDLLTVDQPRVTFALTDESTDPATLIGPTTPGLALLDTAANGILLGQLSYLGGEDYGYVGQYGEAGIGGITQFDVHETWGLRIDDSRGTSHQRLISESVRPFGLAAQSLGSFNAVLGMPAMAGYVIEIDMRPSLGLEFQDVFFHDTLSQATFESAAAKTVPLRILPPKYTDTSLPLELRPTFSGLPAIDGITMQHNAAGSGSSGANVNNSVTLVVDTGAQNTIVSQAIADSLGIDTTKTEAEGGDVVDYLEVGGVGGTVFMPIVEVDCLSITTQDGIELKWTDALVGVLDIPTADFDGVLGNNFLTSGYFDELFLGIPDAHAFDKVVFDFTPTDGTASMRLDFAQTPTLTYFSDFDGDGDVDDDDLNLALANFTGSGTGLGMSFAQGDSDGDGDIDNADLGVVLGELNASVATLVSPESALNQPVPEPGTLALIASASLIILYPRRRKHAD